VSTAKAGRLRGSVRLRLAIWCTGVLALVLVAFAAGTYGYVVRATRERVDRSLAATARSFNDVWALEVSDSVGTPADAARDAARDLRGTDRRVLVYDEAGRRIAVSEDTPLAPLLTSAALATAAGSPVEALVREARERQPSWQTITGPEGGIRAHAAVVSRAGVSYVVVVFADLAGEVEANEDLLRALLLAIPLALLLAGAGGYVLARASLAPVGAMAARADQISAANLHERLPVANAADELGRLAVVLNDLLDRVERAFVQQRQFMADASHELRTPVAALRSAADVTLGRDDRAGAEYREALEVASAEGRRLARIVDDLFLLARADAGQQPVRLEDVALEEVLDDCARSARVLAAGRGVHFEAPHGLESPLRGDPQLLHRLVMNLLDNAIKQTPPGGEVRLTIARGDGAYQIAVRDGGPGVADDLRPRIFERFVRGDPVRGSDASNEGAGLGLSIAKWIAEVHGGRVTLEATGPTGSTFSVSLPVTTAG
jgi:heavy metal sensor kinase